MNSIPAEGSAPGLVTPANWHAGAHRSRQWAREWTADPGWRRLIDPIDAAGTLAELQPLALALLQASDWFDAIVTQWLAIIDATPLAEPPVRASRDGVRRALLLHDGSTATLTATVLPGGVVATQPAQRVVRSGRWTATRYLRAGGAQLERWKVGAGSDQLQRCPDLPLCDGAVIAIDGRMAAQRLVQAAPRPVVMLSISARLDAAPLVHEHDAQTGQLVRVATADDGAARTQMLLRVLRALDRDDAHAHLDAASRGDTAFLRWEAMREWLLLDSIRALPRLRELAVDDPDNAVRAAAAATLERVAERCPA